jgi:hypothetical protein
LIEENFHATFGDKISIAFGVEFDFGSSTILHNKKEKELNKKKKGRAFALPITLGYSRI